MDTSCPQVPGQGEKLEGTRPSPGDTRLTPTTMSLVDQLEERRRGEYAVWREWARDKDNLSTGSSITSEPRQDLLNPSEAQPDIPSERFGKWVRTPASEASQGGTAGRSGHRGDHANLVTKKASILLFLLNSGKHAHMTRGLGRVTCPWGRTQQSPANMNANIRSEL